MTALEEWNKKAVANEPLSDSLTAAAFQEAARLREKALHNEAAALRNARNKAKAETLLSVAKNMMSDGESPEKIMRYTGLSFNEVENLRNADR